MPAQSKPGVDWHAIKARLEAGDSAYGIAKDFPVSKQAILKRAKKEGWLPGPGKWLPATKATDTAQRIANPQNRSDQLLASFGKRTPENMAEVLGMIEDGTPKYVACHAIGISDETLNAWLKDDADFLALYQRAEAEYLQANFSATKKAANRGDPRAAQWNISKHRLTREEYGDKGGGGSGITVNINIPRGDPEDISGEVIDQ
jgi:hypothetical protein